MTETSPGADLPGVLPPIAAPPLGYLAAGLGLLLLVHIAALVLNRTDLYYDEAQYWAWAQSPAFGYFSKPPLIAWLIAASTHFCGDTEACVRLPSPLIHTATALVVYALAARLYDARTGVLAAFAFALIPGVSLSSGIISTDVGLLFFWALALLALAALFETKSWWPALLLGLALGGGLNAKYAMAWFMLCAACYLALTPARRTILRDPRPWAAVAIGVALIMPNLAWNRAHSFATFAHTAENANWHGIPFHPLKALEFLGGQLGVFGPFYFGGLLLIANRARRTSLPEPDRLLLAFSLPLIAIITAQAFLSRAHANWAAAAYVPGSIVVVATLARAGSTRWLNASYALHAALLAAIVAVTSTAGLFRLPIKPDPLSGALSRTLGWHTLADGVSAELARARAIGHPYAAVLTDTRAVTAELIYYLRGDPTPVLAFRTHGAPHDHFELTRPYTPASGEPVLLVSLSGAPSPDPNDSGTTSAAGSFAHAHVALMAPIPAGPATVRLVTLVALSGYKQP